jgi:hypothetical protein
MPTVQQIVTVLLCIVAAVAAIVVGYQIIRLVRAIGRVLVVIATIVAKLLKFALIGGLALGIVAGAVWWAIQPTATAAPKAPTAPRPTPTVGIPTSRAGLLVMSDEEAQSYGEGFQFINLDNTLCILRKVSYQDYLVADCD